MTAKVFGFGLVLPRRSPQTELYRDAKSLLSEINSDCTQGPRFFKAGCRYLLSDGAVLIQSAEDLLSHLGVTRDTVTAAPPPDEPLFTQQAEGPSLASSATEPDQQALLTLLGAETHTVEACATALGWQMERCLSGLVALEVAGKVARAPHGYCALP